MIEKDRKQICCNTPTAGSPTQNRRAKRYMQSLWTVVSYLDVDQAILSRIERGQQKASREQAVKLAAYFNVSEDELLIADEELGIKALKVVEAK
ncbi:MAG: helix-turn-helix transcriptional regulator [Dysgonamonadaceae bacterium]|jgi:transcriptional regulator with XRE-family HTH domain|nr:helix-turn-helix transcriptional regulator [Dysgonamonadaceae bacterium]